MADYKELLRRAISALPENNGAARRAVYEKARSALVGQLRSIQPPLPARDITQHRLQLEDCIRQVEQEASEAIINLGRDAASAAPPVRQAAPPPAAVEAALPKAAPRPDPAPQRTQPVPPRADPAPVIVQPSRPTPASIELSVADTPSVKKPELAKAPPAEIATPAPSPLAPPPSGTNQVMSIEDIIAQASANSGAGVEVESPEPDAVQPDSEPPPAQQPVRFPAFTARREPASQPAAKPFVTLPPRVEPSLGNTALAQQLDVEPVAEEPAPAVDLALSSEREVDVEDAEAREAEGVIERAIETLDREARGEKTETLPDRTTADAETAQDLVDDSGFAIPDTQPRSGTGLTIFLIVFVVLLAGVGGAGFWAWREGYVDLDQMFGRSQPTVTETATVADQPSLPTMDADTGENAAGPGNTATTVNSEPTTALEGLEPEDRLEPTPQPVTPTGNETVLPSMTNGEVKTEERLSGQDTSITAVADPAASVDPAVLAGSQSLLLEAPSDGRSPVVPFSGTVEWSEGVDEIGMPTLVAEAAIPARNLDVSITIRKNADPSLPASHLMEISFDVPDTFIGGSIGALAGVLLKNEELVPGTELTGAAARVVGNSFLFALSASPTDLTNNLDLLSNRRWIDLAIVYGTGRNAILTLEKDAEAQTLFTQVLAAWEQ
jgi:hypothetical protein